MNDQLQGLLIPPKQAEPNLTLWLGVALLFFLLGLVIWRWNKYRKTSVVVAQKKLNHLKSLPCKTVEESQMIALKLAHILCQGLGIKRLDQFQASDESRWLEFHHRLNTACYSSIEKNDIGIGINKNMKSLLNEAQQWLLQG